MLKTFNEWLHARENIQNMGIDQNALGSGMSLLLHYLKQRFKNTPMAGLVNAHPEEAGLNAQQIRACQEFGALSNGGIESNVVQSYFNSNAHTSFRANPNVDTPRKSW
jgi:hypothetical protein